MKTSLPLHPRSPIIAKDYAVISRGEYNYSQVQTSLSMRVDALEIRVRPPSIPWTPSPVDAQVIEVIADRIEILGAERDRWFSAELLRDPPSPRPLFVPESRSFEDTRSGRMCSTILANVHDPEVARLLSLMKRPPYCMDTRWDSLLMDTRTDAARTLHVRDITVGGATVRSPQDPFRNELVRARILCGGMNPIVPLTGSFVLQSGLEASILFVDDGALDGRPYEMGVALIGRVII